MVKALGKKTTRKIRTDVNADVADLLLVIDHLDTPKDAAAPANREIVPLLNPVILSAHRDTLRVQNDGTLTYAQAISSWKVYSLQQNLKGRCCLPITRICSIQRHGYPIIWQTPVML